MAKVPARVLAARVAAILSVDRRAQLARIDVPLLYLRAKADRLVKESAARAILDARPDAQLVELDAPHFLLQTEPEACAVVTRAFIQRCQR